MATQAIWRKRVDVLVRMAYGSVSKRPVALTPEECRLFVRWLADEGKIKADAAEGLLLKEGTFDAD